MSKLHFQPKTQEDENNFRVMIDGSDYFAEYDRPNGYYYFENDMDTMDILQDEIEYIIELWGIEGLFHQEE